MRKRLLAASAAIMATAVCLLFGLAGVASAHEEREIGAFNVEVGFGDEPPYAGFKNSVQLVLSDASGNPVTDLGDTLSVDVTTGDQTTTLAIEPNFEVGGDGTPGDYRAWFIPTRPGTYSFHFTGSIKGQKVDETFTSSPTTFDDVVDPTQAEFPVKDPTLGQVSQRIDQEVPRLNSAIASAEQKAKDDVKSARLLAIVGIALGALGVAAGGTAHMAARRRTKGA
jgi:hypothetical protein